MKDHWHEQIQRYLNGRASEEEAIALQAALEEDAELRALYLDYMNLDAALEALAGIAASDADGCGRTVAFPPSPARRWAHDWRWLAAAAACAALLVFAVLPRHRDVSRPSPDLDATISATQSAIARLSIQPPSPFPEWASPTSALLESPHLPP